MKAPAGLSAGLRRLDDRLLPPAAGRLRRLVARARQLQGRLTGPAAALRADPWGTVRRRPEVGAAALVALLAVAGLALLLDRWSAGPTPVTASTAAPAAVPAPTQVVSLGPRAGERVSAYAAAAARRVSHYAAAHPRAATYALVDFTGYLTPAQLAAVVGADPLARAFVRAPSPDAQLHVVSVAAAAAVPAQLTQLSQEAAREALGFRQLLQVLLQSPAQSGSPIVRLYRERTAQTEAEAKSFGPACPCVYAVLLRADGRALARLARVGGVRVVDPAPYRTPLDALATIALQPAETTVVPASEGFQ